MFFEDDPEILEVNYECKDGAGGSRDLFTVENQIDSQLLPQLVRIKISL